jgi:hypothetical protein
MDYEWVIKNHPLGRLLITRIKKGDEKFTKSERRHINKLIAKNNREFFKNVERTTSPRSIIMKPRWRLLRKLSNKTKNRLRVTNETSSG